MCHVSEIKFFYSIILNKVISALTFFFLGHGWGRVGAAVFTALRQTTFAGGHLSAA